MSDPMNHQHPINQFIPLATWNLIEPHFTEFGRQKLIEVIEFVKTECIPAESIFNSQISPDTSQRWERVPQVIEDLKSRARSKGLWNLFLSKAHYPDVGVPLTNLEYAVMAEVMGHAIRIAPESMNCSAPDTGNMEVLARYGTAAQKERWLKPLLEGKIRSSFSMTEPAVASSDATNIQTQLTYDHQNQQIIVNGRKWWISGAGDPRNKIHLVMGKSDTSAPKHSQQSIVLVPSDAPGVKLIRPMQVFGYDDAPEGHFEVVYDNVRVPVENLVHGWGKGFEIVQSRLGPGRIHHCMRAIGMAERAIEIMLLRVTEPHKKTFGKLLYQHGSVSDVIARSRIELDGIRMLVYSAALQIDLHKAKGAMKSIGMAKAIVPKVVGEIIDRAIQVHGGEGLSQDQPLAAMFGGVRTLRMADGPDEVHLAQVAKQELARVADLRRQRESFKTIERAYNEKYGIFKDDEQRGKKPRL
ncbi:acyl-CoA dehydrogenase [Phakopsora pachyrhizi]|uniref:Acyl-CoA dehydrogenase n=1 Tax=Phakopsora pachyrhizi TaxID=170000 RepID=A0AAV0BU03_PHAPC|nr:acyl-CoA dehydrogenase [Phakopsora pachyrhizi]CAH7689074.1 acyl-CoA dehydrogenase [Phakopsora pachyrhizi]